MYDARYFDATYDLYRPTVSTSESGVQSRAVPTTATASARPCRFFPTPGRMSRDARGLDMDFDAVLLAPAGADLRPAQQSQQPDVVHINSRRYTVLAVWPLAGAARGVKALLVETRG